MIAIAIFVMTGSRVPAPVPQGCSALPGKAASPPPLMCHQGQTHHPGPQSHHAWHVRAVAAGAAVPTRHCAPGPSIRVSRGSPPNVRRPVTMVSQERAERTRQRLLQGAAAEFSLYGYGGTSLQRISKAAGVTMGALTFHFP